MSMNWSKRQRLLGYVFVGPSMIGVLLFYLFPALYSFYLMFTDWVFFSGESPTFIGLDNLKRLFDDPLFYTSLGNTLLFVTTVPVFIGIAFVLAIVLNNNVYFKNALRSMFFIPYVMNGVAIAFVWMLLFKPNGGPINKAIEWFGFTGPGWLSSTETAMYAINIIYIWFHIGYALIIYLAALQEIPSELLEAAKIDGAKYGQVIRHITLPLVSPTTLLLFITGFISTIKTFGLIQAVTGGGPGDSTTLLSIFVYKTAFRYYEMGYASTISWVLFSCILIITSVQWYAQKKWVHY
ncbi:carbohydrate ABC transporter permease [Paenibacillus sp. GCM10023252]|uniref:carbohydrate ABC transporter permease n=1 Tax=Paenibacillus sp. GCM10023252 TaxID=3252649 RepID=UPI003607E9CB